MPRPRPLRCLAVAVAIIATLGVALAIGARQPGTRATRVVLVVVDGLRPDQVTPEVMPRLSALGARGMTFERHHAVVPTVTRVNASSMATGTYPESHGLLGNTVYSAATAPTRTLNTASHADLEAMAAAEGRLLSVPSLGIVLEGAGKRLVVMSAGSSGSALLLAHPLAGNTAIVNPDLIRPAALADAVTAAAGPGPKEAVPNTARNRWIVDAWKALAPDALAADVTIVWFADPDETAHATGLGSTATTGALRAVDADIGRIEDDLRARRQLETTTLLVVSDHGFSTHSGDLRLAALVAPFARPFPDGAPDLVVAEGAVHARGPVDPSRLASLVAALQARPEVGAIFTAPARPGLLEGRVPGTLAFDAARWQHARSGLVLVSGNWTAAVNAAGVAGFTTQTGVAGHGTTSPYDIHNTWIASGPSVRRQARGVAPTSNADLAPTILTLLGVPVPATMTGRIVRELLTNGPAPDAVAVTRAAFSSTSVDGRYAVTAHVSTVDGRRYLDSTEVRRTP